MHSAPRGSEPPITPGSAAALCSLASHSLGHHFSLKASLGAVRCLLWTSRVYPHPRAWTLSPGLSVVLLDRGGVATSTWQHYAMPGTPVPPLSPSPSTPTSHSQHHWPRNSYCPSCRAALPLPPACGTTHSPSVPALALQLGTPDG